MRGECSKVMLVRGVLLYLYVYCMGRQMSFYYLAQYHYFLSLFNK